MKIGLISSGYEMLPLMQVLNKFDHEYHVYLDRSHRPWGDKSSDLRELRVKKALEYFQGIGIELVIVPPVLELQFSQVQTSENLRILPLFQTYMQEFGFKYSLVGKIGLLCESADMAHAQELISTLSEEYVLSENQQKTKAFQKTDFSWSYWKKNLRMRSYFLTTYGRREPMLRKTLKYDLRFFSDADVDTLVPMSRGFLFYQKIIRQRTNWKKIRFHGLDAVQECFEKLGGADSTSEGYSCTLHYTDKPSALLEEKKWMQVLSRGREVEIKEIEVDYDG